MARKQAEFVGDPRYCSSSFYIARTLNKRFNHLVETLKVDDPTANRSRLLNEWIAAALENLER